MSAAQRDAIGRAAYISDDGLYRYRLYRWWVEQPKRWVLWVMLNPSTADGETDDATIRRCIAFSRRWGFDGLMVGNLFGLRSTDPAGLYRVADPIGPLNAVSVRGMATSCELVVCGWGSQKVVTPAVAAVMARDIGKPLHCLGLTKNGHPRHPLYLSNESKLIEFNLLVAGMPR